MLKALGFVSFLCAACVCLMLSSVGVRVVKGEISYHLKWVTKEPILPIFLEKRFSQSPQSGNYILAFVSRVDYRVEQSFIQNIKYVLI